MDHLKRIQKAIDFIEIHLKDKIDTEIIAKEACFSMWHFQHVFSSIVGDSVKAYIRKRRLTSALIELATSKRKIIDIAFDYQFESQESFSRAFKTLFDCTPGECQKKKIKSIIPHNKLEITFEYLEHLFKGVTMQPQFVTLEEKKIIGIGTTFISILSPEKNNHIVIPKLWDKYLKRTGEIKNRKNDFSIGLCEYIADKTQKKHPDECLYMAGVEVSDFSFVPEEMTSKIIPAGRYAIFTHKGTLDKLEHTMNYIFGSWLPKSGEELRDAPDLELYDHRFKHDSENSEIDIYIPIK